MDQQTDRQAKPLIELCAGLILERARKPDALYIALGLSCFASSEPGGLSLIEMDLKRSS